MIKKTIFIPIITVVVGLVFSFLVSFSLYKSEKKAAFYEMQKEIDGAALSFSRELNVSVDLLYIIQNQIWNDRTMNKFMFDHVAGKLSERLPYIDSIHWIEAVRGKDKMDYENKMSERYVDYAIHHLGLSNQKNSEASNESSHYFPISYTTNQSMDPKLQGLDLLSLDFVRKEIQKSWLQGIPIAVFDVNLQRSLLAEHGFFVFFPIFFESANTQDERKNQIRGLFLVALDIVTMFESVLVNTTREPLKLALERYSKNETKTLYQNVEGVAGKLDKNKVYSSKSFFFGGNEWQITGIPTEEYFSARVTFFPYIIFMLGSAIFVLIGYLVYMVQFRALHIQHRIAIKTRELREMNDKLEKMSRTDGITGLFNRAYFDECLHAEVKRAQRDELPISILLVEVDNLKKYIDQNGMSAADNALRIIALALAEVLKRPSDLIARYDTDAFAAILPNTQNGLPIAESCMQAIRTLKIPFSLDHEACISISVGGVSMLNVQEITSEKLNAHAQIALSKAIAQGRNRVQWIFSPEENDLPKMPPI